MQKPTVSLTQQETIEQEVMTQLTIVEEQLKYLNRRVDEVMSDLKDIKNLHIEKVIALEKEVYVLKEKVDRQEWFNRLVLGLALSGVIGAILSLVLKH